MRRAGFVVLVFLLLVPLAVTQVPNKVNIFAGFSYSNVNSFAFANGNRLHLTGWQGAFEAKLYHWVGFVADVDSRSGTLCPGPVPACAPGNITMSQSDVLFGPRLAVPLGRVRPFAEGLFGFEHVTTNQFGPDKSLATALGGGVDYRLARHAGWRFQADFMHTSLFSSKQNNVRLSTGLVVRF
jgi:hypothetical protein